MLHAIIETGGKQYRVGEGDILFIEKLNVNDGDEVVFDKVLAVIGDESSRFGTPVVDGASVKAKVIKNGKGNESDENPTHHFLSFFGLFLSVSLTLGIHFL